MNSTTTLQIIQHDENPCKSFVSEKRVRMKHSLYFSKINKPGNRKSNIEKESLLKSFKKFSNVVLKFRKISK